MFGLNPYSLALKAGVILIALLGGFYAGHTVTHNAWEAAQAKALEQQASQRVADETRLNDLSAQLETAKAKRDVVTKVITRKVDRIVEVYRARACLDPDGVSVLNSAIRGAAADSAGHAGSVPGNSGN